MHMHLCPTLWLGSHGGLYQEWPACAAFRKVCWIRELLGYRTCITFSGIFKLFFICSLLLNSSKMYDRNYGHPRTAQQTPPETWIRS